MRESDDLNLEADVSPRTKGARRCTNPECEYGNRWIVRKMVRIKNGKLLCTENETRAHALGMTKPSRCLSKENGADGADPKLPTGVLRMRARGMRLTFSHVLVLRVPRRPGLLRPQCYTNCTARSQIVPIHDARRDRTVRRRESVNDPVFNI
jgi:hypothetical protein